MEYFYANRTKAGWSQVMRHKCQLRTETCSVFHHDREGDLRKEELEDEIVLDLIGSFSTASNLAALSNNFHWSFRPWLSAKTADKTTN